MEQPHHVPEPDEINLVALLQKVWRDRMIIIIISGLFTLIGIVYALGRTNVYTATTTFIPKGQTSNAGGSLSGLASLAGINLGGLTNSDSEIPPSMYPMVVKSIPFQEKILALSISMNGKKIQLKEYLLNQLNHVDPNSSSFLNLLKKYTIGLPAIIKRKVFAKMNALPSSTEMSTIKRLSHEDGQLRNYLKNIIHINVDKKEGFIKLTCKDKDPQVAAIVALNAQALLQEKVINFKIKNTQELLTFTEKLYSEKKVAFEILQDELANFRDQHQNISSGLFENKLNRLESELAIARAVYEELAKQVEQTRIQVSKDTPIFTIIDPVVIPNQRTSPKRVFIVISSAFLGLLVGLAYIFFKEPMKNLAKEFAGTDVTIN